jgi:hypothetical protein
MGRPGNANGPHTKLKLSKRFRMSLRIVKSTLVETSLQNIFAASASQLPVPARNEMILHAAEQVKFARASMPDNDIVDTDGAS